MLEKWFEGRTALVTGGARGIGRAICETLAARGARLALSYQTSRRAAEEMVARLNATGSEAIAVRADVSDQGQVTSMVQEVCERLGPVDLLVNNAAVFDLLAPGEMTPEVWHRTLAVNLTGAYQVTWAIKDGMLARRYGRIVNLSSISALRPRPRSIAYSVSKAGLIALTRCCAEAWAASNVRVNAVAPGLIDTDMIAGAGQPLIDKLISETPLGRIGQPADVAGAVAFLLSEQSAFITGQTLVICGGRVMLP